MTLDFIQTLKKKFKETQIIETESIYKISIKDRSKEKFWPHINKTIDVFIKLEIIPCFLEIYKTRGIFHYNLLIMNKKQKYGDIMIKYLAEYPKTIRVDSIHNINLKKLKEIFDRLIKIEKTQKIKSIFTRNFEILSIKYKKEV